jgi:hypothetical protein
MEGRIFSLTIGLILILSIFSTHEAQAQYRKQNGKSFYHLYYQHRGGAHWLSSKKQCRRMKRFRKKRLGMPGVFFWKKKKPAANMYRPQPVDYYEYRRKLKQEYYLSQKQAKE